jgi:hypothetical protein
MSLPWESSWAIFRGYGIVVVPYWEGEPPTGTTHMQMLVLRKIFEDGNTPCPGLFAAPYLKS